MDNPSISSPRQEGISGNSTTFSKEEETEFNSVSVEDSTHESIGDSNFSLLEAQSMDSVLSIEKDKEHDDSSYIKPTLSVTEDNDNDNILSVQNTQSERESKEDSYVEEEDDLEHIEQDDDDQELLFVQHPEDNGDSDNMVTSIDTSDDTGSENSLSMRDDSSGMLISPPEIRTPSSSSQNSEDNRSVESMPTGDVMYYPSDSLNQNEYVERDIPVLPAPGETREQILAPLDINEDEEDEDEEDDDKEDEGKIQLTPILTRAIETDDDPPSPTLSEFVINANNSNSSSNNNRSRSHLQDILLRHQRNNSLDFSHIPDSSIGEIALNIFHHQILIPFFQGFSWGIGIHLYRYMRNSLSIRSFWRSLSGGVRGTSHNVAIQ